MKISVCIASYRGARRLPALLDSLRPMARELHEVIVYDDGSPDGTIDATGAIRGDLPLTLIYGQENAGYCAGVRRAVAQSTGEIIWLLDDDVTVPFGIIPTMRQLLDIPGMGVLSWRSYGSNPGQSVREVPGFLEPATQLASYCMAFHKITYNIVGGFDSRFRTYCADSDFVLRVAQILKRPSYRVWWPLVPHKEHAAFEGSSLDRGAIAGQDLAAFAEKWGASGEEMERRTLEEFRR